MFRANGEIAEVRAKNKAETSALQVQLRREQLRVESLEKCLDQKVGEGRFAAGRVYHWRRSYALFTSIFPFFQKKEAEELTKLCDELISKVQSG